MITIGRNESVNWVVHIRVFVSCPTNFFHQHLKQPISNEIGRAEHEYMNMNV